MHRQCLLFVFKSKTSDAFLVKDVLLKYKAILLIITMTSRREEEYRLELEI